MTSSIMASGDDLKETHLLLLFICFFAVFPCSVYNWIYFGRLPQMAATKKVVQLLLSAMFFCFGLTSTNNKGRHRYQEMGIAQTV